MDKTLFLIPKGEYHVNSLLRFRCRSANRYWIRKILKGGEYGYQSNDLDMFALRA